VLWRLLSLATLAAAWQSLAAAYGDPRLLPGPVHVLTHSLPDMSAFAPRRPGPAWTAALAVIGAHSFITTARLVAGLAVGAALGFAAGLAAHFFKRTARANALALMIVRAVPLMALIPLFVYWFGNRPVGILAYIAFGAFVVTAPATYEAASDVPPHLLDQARMLGARRVRRFLTIYPFAMQPQLFPALRDLVGLGWAFSLGAEYVAAPSGLGHLARYCYEYTDMGRLLVVAGVYCVYGYASYLIVTAITRRLGAWYLPGG
jgi:sulfonate transport system permease protein